MPKQTFENALAFFLSLYYIARVIATFPDIQFKGNFVAKYWENYY